MKIEIDGWEPMLQVPPSDRLVVSYGGPYAQNLQFNRPTLERFLAVASLDGRVLLEESKVRRPRTLLDGVNPDGSVTGRGRLRWGEKLEVLDLKQNPYFQVQSDEAGWKIAINGDLIREDMVERSSQDVRMITPRFADRFNYYFRIGLKEALLKDKCTFEKDPYLSGRILWSLIFAYNSVGVVNSPTPLTVLLEGIYLFTHVVLNFETLSLPENERMEFVKNYDRRRFFPKVFNLSRRSVHSLVESFDIPFEIDRLVLALGYLDWQMLKRNPLVRLNPH